MNQALENWLAQPGRTAKKLAADCGVREATVSAWRRGIVPRPPQMQRVAEATAGAVPPASWFPPLPRGEDAATEAAA